MAQEQIDYKFLLLTHVVCADRQIHSEESKYLRELAKRANVGQLTQDEMEKVLTQDEHHLTFDYIVCQIPLEQQSEAMRQVLAIAYSDGFFAPLEREMVAQIARLWNWLSKEIDQIIEEAQGFTSNHLSNKDNNLPKLSFAARFLKNEKKSALSRAIIDMATKLAPKSIGLKVKQLERELLLAGPEYDEAIERCANIASEDYQYAEVALNQARSTFHDLVENLQQAIEEISQQVNDNGRATSAEEVAKQLEISRQALTAEIIKEMENVRESLYAKQRARNYFSIAFMGKTKAGKSTLHAIITGEEWEAIGVGKQRTTRLNRIYEWKNIRVIDTPGIGAPGGKTDEEIAESVIEESDVICYVVTNDSIQETEFQFLKLLKEKAKPLIILLNIKYNLRDARRLEHFLQNPNKLFTLEGKSGLGGHIERIRRYAKEHYANDYFDIVPVMLLAAQLSSESEHKEHKEKLFKASQMQDFLDSIREFLIKHGAIRRSQTFLGSTVGAIDVPTRWVTQQAKIYQKLTDTLKDKRQSIQSDVEKAKQDTLEYLQQQIEEVFQDAFNTIPAFAEDHWNVQTEEMNKGWSKRLSSIRFEERLRNAFEEVGEKFNQEVQEVLEEVGKELQLISQLSDSKFKLTEQDSFDFKHLMKIGGSLLFLAGTLLSFFAPPVGLIIGIVGTAINLAARFFKSKEQKRREAVNNISGSLIKQLEKHKQKILEQSKNDFSKHCSDVAKAINDYLDELIKGLEAIAIHLETAQGKLDGIANDLNRAYAKRIIDWCLEQYEPLNNKAINRIIAEVKRDFGRSMKIKTLPELRLIKSQDEIKQVLQEDVFIQNNQ